MINENDLKNFAINKFKKADLDKLIKNIHIGEIVKAYRIGKGEAIYISKVQSNGDVKFYLWLLHKSGMLLRSGNGSVGYSTLIRAEIETGKVVKQRAV